MATKAASTKSRTPQKRFNYRIPPATLQEFQACCQKNGDDPKLTVVGLFDAYIDATKNRRVCKPLQLRSEAEIQDNAGQTIATANASDNGTIVNAGHVAMGSGTIT